MLKRYFCGILLGLSMSGPALADWTLRQGNGFAMTTYVGDKFEVFISCNRGRGLEITLGDRVSGGSALEGVKNLMVWLTLPDGRTDRWPVSVFHEAPGVSGELVVSDFNLDFFRQGQTFQIDSPLTGQVFLDGNMKGTGAARLAFKEQCGI